MKTERLHEFLMSDEFDINTYNCTQEEKDLFIRVKAICVGYEETNAKLVDEVNLLTKEKAIIRKQYSALDDRFNVYLIRTDKALINALDAKAKLVEENERLKNENKEYKERLNNVNKFINNTPNDVVTGFNTTVDRLESELSAAKERVKELEGDECLHPFNLLDIDKKLKHHFCKKCGTFVYKPTNP